MHENLLKDIGLFEGVAHHSTYHLRNISSSKLYGNAHSASEIRMALRDKNSSLQLTMHGLFS